MFEEVWGVVFRELMFGVFHTERSVVNMSIVEVLVLAKIGTDLTLLLCVN